MTYELVVVPCLTDNYSYILRAGGATAVIDAPEAAPILRALDDRGWTADMILLTHHHDDHIAGVPALAGATGARVLGAGADAHRLPPLDRALAPGDRVEIGPLDALVLDAPGHTIGHIAYVVDGGGEQPGLAFTGDSLMSWGCGRLFEGTPAQMFATLARLAALPADTLICSGHEYTLANGRFALSLAPDATALTARMRDAQTAREAGRPTLPAPLALELTTNPFLRSDDARLRAALDLPADAPPLAVFTAARARKDRF